MAKMKQESTLSLFNDQETLKPELLHAQDIVSKNYNAIRHMTELFHNLMENGFDDMTNIRLSKNDPLYSLKEKELRNSSYIPVQTASIRLFESSEFEFRDQLKEFKKIWPKDVYVMWLILSLKSQIWDFFKLHEWKSKDEIFHLFDTQQKDETIQKLAIKLIEKKKSASKIKFKNLEVSNQSELKFN